MLWTCLRHCVPTNRRNRLIDDGEIIENTDTRSLLGQLQQETYVLDLLESLENLPHSLGQTGQWLLRNPSTLEVTIPKTEGINTIFDQLTRCGIRVQSMRNKSNRLEQLFLELTGNKPVAAAAPRP